MSEINGIEERLNDLPGSEALSRLTASRASGWPQLSGAEGGMDMGGEGYILDASGECADLKYRSGREPLRSILQAFISIFISIPNSYI